MPICEWAVPIHMVQLLQGTQNFQVYTRVVPVVMHNCLQYGMSLCSDKSMEDQYIDSIFCLKVNILTENVEQMHKTGSFKLLEIVS